MRFLISGSSGLIGGQTVEYFDGKGHAIIGLDNHQRKEFFGDSGDSSWNLHKVFHVCKNFKHHGTDIRNRHAVDQVFKEFGPFDAVIHCAAQPSHDKSRDIPLVDFDINAVGTLNLLEATRQHSSNAVFLFLSSNKVYGTAPNEIQLIEDKTRYDYLDEYFKGIDENCRIDQSTHSIFGASKVAADVLVQEYGRYFGLKTTVFRGGCLTGPGHSGVELHGFLSYLVKTCISGNTYKIYGYKGKQVRDNLHSYDVVRAMEEVIANPGQGDVFNLGGGRENSVSILEAIEKIEKLIGKKIKTEYVDTPRVGDHICYISDMRKFCSKYPKWKVTKSIDDILLDIAGQEFWGVETEHLETLTYPLTKDSIVLDIGGYRGTYSKSIIDRYDPHVFIFEPIKEYYDECCRRFAANPKVKVFNFGLSDKAGRATFQKDGIRTSEFIAAAQPEEVEIRDIADVLPFDKIDLVSINCEGGEYKILNRLLDTNLIDRITQLQVQFHDLFPEAKVEREKLRGRLREKFNESFNFEFIWESWQTKSSV